MIDLPVFGVVPTHTDNELPFKMARQLGWRESQIIESSVGFCYTKSRQSSPKMPAYSRLHRRDGQR
jgi:hypothetical protein